MNQLTKFFAVITLFSVLTISCTSNDDVIRNPDPIELQTEVGTQLPFEGNYSYVHGGNPIPFSFTKTQITMLMSQMTGSNQTDDIYNIIKVYKNTEDIYKVVTKHNEVSEYKAFFLKNITDASLKFNMDYSFTSEIEAIEVKYPSSSATTPDHATGKFGWLTLTKTKETSNPINLPVTGKYIFSQDGHTYSYTLANDKINFNGAYDMIVLKHNTVTNKILLEGINENTGKYYVMQLKSITENTVDIARSTFGETDAKTTAETEFASSTELTSRFTTYTKENSSSNNAFSILNGTYNSAMIGDNLAYYQFQLGANNEAFLFFGDFAGSGTYSEGGKLALERVYTDEAKGQLIYKITGSEGYYAGRTNQYLTLYVKSISTDGKQASFAIATKDGSTSISSSKGDVIGTTLEQAKSIAAPDAMAIWQGDMMSYAHVWIPTQKQ